MSVFTVYSPDTGRISKLIFAENEPRIEEGQSILAGYFRDDHFFIEDGVPIPRPKLEMPENIEIKKGESLPGDDIEGPVDVYINGHFSGNTLDIISSLPEGNYSVGVNPLFPTKGATFSLTVIPADEETD